MAWVPSGVVSAHWCSHAHGLDRSVLYAVGMAATRIPARQRLLEAADRLFYAEGVHTVGIDRIIEEAGVAKGSLFYNFSGKDELVAAYLAGRVESRRDQTLQHQAAVEGPIAKILAVFDALQEVVSSPTFRGCPMANANAEAKPGGVEARALRDFRRWFADMLLALAIEAGFTDPADVSRRIRLLYDGAIANGQLDREPDAALLARDLALDVLESAPKTDVDLTNR